MTQTAESSPAPLFIVGAPRSGTSLLRDLIRLAGDVYLPPDELQILPTLATRWHDIDAPSRRALLDGSAFAEHLRAQGLWPGASVLSSCARCEDWRGAIERLVLAVARADGVDDPSMWGDKTPENILHLDVIKKAWPDARVLFIVRDPRAVVASMKRAWRRSITRSAMIWRDAERARVAFDGNAMTVSYTVLVREPAATITSIYAWLGLPVDVDRLADYRGRERWGQVTAGSGVVSTPDDAWRRTLSAREQARVESIAFCELGALGYAPEHAVATRDVSVRHLRVLCALDALNVLRAYTAERGLAAALDYKWRQWARRPTSHRTRTRSASSVRPGRPT